MTPHTLIRAIPFLLWIIAFEATSFTSAMLTGDNIESWYATLDAPPLVPPNGVFPVVWSLLYAATACAGCLLWQRKKRRLLAVFAAYMVLNWSWSFVYFEMHRMGLALVGLCIMDILLVVLIRGAWGRLRPAAALLSPLLAWSLFATYLNAGYWWLN